jgi:hypothetical protein
VKVKLILGASILLLVSGQINASSIVVNTEAEFLSMAGSVVTEGFESFPTDLCGTGSTSLPTTITTTNFSVTTNPQDGGTSSLCIGTTNFGIPGPTEGDNALIAGSPTGDSWILDFTLDRAYAGVYFELTDAAERGDAFISFNGIDDILIASEGSGGLNTIFFGIFPDHPFQSFSLINTGFADGWGIDNMILSPVPVPAAVWLFGTALIGLVGFSKRRKAA